MTLPDERTAAILRTRRWLYELLDGKGRIGRTELRRMASILLRHYPTPLDMECPADSLAPRPALDDGKE